MITGRAHAKMLTLRQRIIHTGQICLNNIDSEQVHQRTRFNRRFIVHDNKERTRVTARVSPHACTHSHTFWLWDNELHLLGGALHDLCRLAIGDPLQADMVQRDQSATWVQRSQWNVMVSSNRGKEKTLDQNFSAFGWPQSCPWDSPRGFVLPWFKVVHHFGKA